MLGGIWEDARPIKPGSCHMILSDAMFYFYHMAHMTKHFEVGGCGIRTFLDIWVLQNRVEYDPAQREKLLREGGLWKFARGAEQVADWWFNGAQPDEMTRQVSDYILLLRRVFMPYDFLKAEYPILQTHKWLTPVYQVVRWVRMLLGVHSDHQLGKITGFAINKGIHIAYGPKENGVIEIQ